MRPSDGAVDARDDQNAAVAVVVGLVSFPLFWFLTTISQIVLYLRISPNVEEHPSSLVPELLLISTATGIVVRILRLRAFAVVAVMFVVAASHLVATLSFQLWAYFSDISDGTFSDSTSVTRPGAYGDWVLLTFLTWCIVVLLLCRPTQGRFQLSLSAILFTLIAFAVVLAIVTHFWQQLTRTDTKKRALSASVCEVFREAGWHGGRTNRDVETGLVCPSTLTTSRRHVPPVAG